MDFALSDELQMLREMARGFASEKIAPFADEWDEKHYLPYEEVIKPMAELGFFGTVIPEEYGGNGMGWLAAILLTEEIARASSSLRVQVNMLELGCAFTILTYGSEELKRKYIPKLVSGEYLGGFAITEPNAGSDVSAIETRAVKRGDRYVINGAKTWISNCSVFDVGVVFVKTDPAAGHKGISALIIEPGLPGLTARDIEPKMGHYCSPTGMLFFEDVEVPATNLLGPENGGFTVAMRALDRGRLSVAAGAVGVAQACVDASTAYANERSQFGRPIAEYQMIQHKIADMAAGVEAARLLTYRSGFLKDQGRRDTRESAIAKYVASEVCVKSANDAVEIFGGNAYSEEYPVSRLLRDAKLYQIGEGSSNIMRRLIALDALGLKKANG
jgi:glutaryl-CoA dehydrogenase (non-decarboxylating)